MRAPALSTLCLFALLLAGCAGQHSGGDAQQTPLPQMHGRAVVLTNANLPPQGSNFRGSDNKWQVHGVIDDVLYRYGEADPTHLYVANTRRTDPTTLSARNSWSVSCVAITPTVHCAIEAPPGGGLAVVDDFVCRLDGGGGAGRDSITMSDGRSCVAVDDPGRVRQDLMAGRTTDGGVSGYGFRQAVTLRDWMIRIVETGRAK